MGAKKHFPLKFVKDLSKEFGLPLKELKGALEEGLDVWERVKEKNQQNRENSEEARSIKTILADYKRSKQKTVNDQVRELIEWYKEFTGSGVSEDQAIEEIKCMFSRPSGRPQMSQDSPPIDLGALRYFAFPLKKFWEFQGGSWTVTSKYPSIYRDKDKAHSPAERFLHQCAQQLEPHISQSSVRAIVENPFLTNSRYSYDPDEQDLSEYFESALITDKGLQYIKQSDTSWVQTPNGPVLKKNR